MSLIARFNPHDMPKQLVLTLATGRDDECAQIRDAIDANLAAGVAGTHLLVTAPRGFGKSFLMRLTQIEVEDRRLAGEPLAIALLPEEQMNITTPDLLLREIRRAFLGEAPETVIPRWDRGGLWADAQADLNAAMDAQFGKEHGLLVAVIENLDQLLDKAFSEPVDEALFRRWLNAQDTRVMVIGGSASGDVDKDHKRPLFQQFTPIELHGWSEADCVAYLRLLVAEKGGELTGEREAKARAIATFIGGNPRLSVILGDVLLSDDALNTAGLLDRLVDELTPYYQDRIGSLGGRAQSLLDALLRGGEPCSQSALAERVGAKQSDIARAFKELQVARIVVGERAQGGKDSLYRVEDRVFAHYYRKRHLWHGQDYSPFAAITEFLKLYFNNDEKRAQALSLAERGHMDEAKLLFGLAQQERPRIDPGLRGALAHFLGRRCLKAIASIEPALAGDLRPIVEVMNAGDAMAARAMLARFTVPEPVEPWYNLLMALNEYVAGRDEEAVRRALAPCAPEMQRNANLLAAFCLAELSRYEEAAAMAREAACVNDVTPRRIAMRIGTFSLGRLGRHEEAVAMAREAAALAASVGDVRDKAKVTLLAGWSLGQLGRYEEAVAMAREAAALAASVGDVRDQAIATLQAGWSLSQLGRYEEAVAMAREAVALAASVEDVREQASAKQLGAWSLGRLGRHEEAVAMAREAAALAASVGDVRDQAIATLQAGWSLGRLGRHEEAVAMTREAAALAASAGDVSRQAEAMVTAAWSLGGLGRHEEAVAMAREAASLAACAADVRGQAEAMRHAARSLNDLGKYEEALISANIAIRLAESIQDLFEWSRSLALAVDSAAHLQRDEQVLILSEEFLTLFSGKREDPDLLSPGYWMRHLGPALIRRNRWSDGLPLLCRAFASTTDRDQGNAAILAASAVTDLSSSAGRAEAYAAVAGCLHALAPSLGEPDAEFGSFVQTLLDGIATQVTDPGLLSDIAALVRQALPARFATQAAMLDAASLFHAAGRDPASLQRVDPDIAIAIRRVWAVPDEQPTPPKKPRRKAKPA